MNRSEFLSKRKAHLIFVGAFIVVLTLNVIIGFTEGRTFMGATAKAIREMTLMDYLMFALFWYACAVHRPKDGRASSLISLNLSNTEK